MLSGAIRTHLKNVFWPHIFVSASFQFLRSASGGPAVSTHKHYRIRREVPLSGRNKVPAKPLGEDGILNQNPIFETGSRRIIAYALTGFTGMLF
jgi:hypothetical protein